MNTIQEAKDFIVKNSRDGVRCPCCAQFVKIYKRPLNSMMAKQLILIYRWFVANPGEQWVHASQFLTHVRAVSGGECAKLRFWGLIDEAAAALPTNGAKHHGLYAITDLGRDFVLCKVRVPKYIFLYNQNCMGLSDTDTTSIQEALSTKFDYATLMNS